MDQQSQATILVVDDREENRYTTRRILTRAGYHVLEAETGHEALDMALTHKPDLVVLDVHLPDMDGFEVCRHIKTAVPTSFIPVLHLSASFVESEDRVHGLECGADGYLTQPIQADEIVATVRALLRARRAEEEVRITNQKLIEADQRKDEFLAMLAHELRNPLAPVRYAVQMLRAINTDIPAAQRQHDIIDRQITHMARLLDDLLDVSRITQGKVKLQQERIDLRAVAEQAVEVLKPIVLARNHKLIFNNAPQPLWVMGDFTRLEQTLRNLLANAAKYTEVGGRIEVTMGAKSSAGAGDNQQAFASVKDSGIGIAPEMLPHVFDLFAQADRSLDRSQGGLGIGLTLVKRIVHLHGGRVEARSEGLGHGSEFVIYLPLLEHAGEHLDKPDVAPARPGTPLIPRRRILVVEDNQDAAQTLSELLELWGHQVRMAHEGQGALTIAREFRPEIVLLDIGLPGMNGYEVARRLREEHGRDSMVLVAMTGYGQDEDREQARQAGFDRHFTKPVSIDALLQLLGQAIPKCN